MKRRTHLRPTWILASLILYSLFETVAWADSSPEGGAELDLAELMALDVASEVAAKDKDSLATVPSSVTVFTQNDIRRLGVRTLEELLNYVPGYQTSRDVEQGTANRISSRGRSTAISESVLILQDGQRLNDLYTGGASILNRNIVIEHARQVEIIRGPGSALYGSNAFLGVVNIVTDQKSNSITIQGGLPAGGALSGRLSTTLGPVEIHGNVNARLDDGFELDVNDQFGQTGSTQDYWDGVDANIGAKIGDLKVSFRHMQREQKGSLVFGTLSDANNREQTRQTSGRVSYDFEFSDSVSGTVGIGGSIDKWDTVALLVPQGVELAPDFALGQDFVGGPLLESYYFSSNVDFRFDLFEANVMHAGLLYERAGITNVANQMTHHPVQLEYMGGLTVFDGQDSFNQTNDRNILGVYLQDRHKFGPLTVTGGVRMDYYDDFGVSVNPRAALVYQLFEDTSLKAMYGRAFRAPNFLELYDRNNPVDFGNDALEPEVVDTIELAWVQSLSFARMSVTGFFNNTNQIIILDAPVDHSENPLGAPRFINRGSQEVYGAEVDLRASPVQNLLVLGSFTWLEGEQLPVGAFMGSLGLSYDIGPVTLNANAVVRDASEAVEGQDAYALISTGAAVRLPLEMQLSVWARNLADTRYQTVSSMFTGGVTNRGREFFATLRWSPGS